MKTLITSILLVAALNANAESPVSIHSVGKFKFLVESPNAKLITNIYNEDGELIHKEYFVAFGKCTHMGCIPLLRQDAFVCPCHGSSFDLAGRVAVGVPAPRNLDIPNYHFSVDGKTLTIGA